MAADYGSLARPWSYHDFAAMFGRYPSRPLTAAHGHSRLLGDGLGDLWGTGNVTRAQGGLNTCHPNCKISQSHATPKNHALY